MNSCVLCSARVDPSTALVWRKDGFDIVRCPSCGFVFRADPPDETELGRIYDEEYFRDEPDRADKHGYADYLRDEPMHRANARRRLKLLRRWAPERGSLLDVGCAAGFFVDEARLAGWNASGVDVSMPMVSWARSQLHLSVARSTFVHAEPAGELFDAITMWDYIEHSIDPRAELKHARDHLDAGGVVALSTGDMGSVVARLSGRRWHLLTPEHHNYFFSEGTLLRLLEATGFSVLEARHRAGLYSLGHVVYKAGTLVPAGSIRRAASRVGRSRLGSAGIPLNLFDIVTVVARRK